jgi:hypothetical protein
MRRTEKPNRYGRRFPMNEDRNLALPAVPAASTKGSTSRQQVAAARTLPTAEIAAANVPFEEGFVIALIVSVFMMLMPRFHGLTLVGLSALPAEPSPSAED